MPARTSAGLVLYRRGAALEVLLGHMGGPYFARKDDGAWSIPKGEYDDTEAAFDAARREFAEEIGVPAPEGEYLDLGSVKQRNGKIVSAGRSKATSTRRRWCATRSNSSGRRVPVSSRPFRSWTAWRGSTWRPRGRKH